MKLHTKTTWIVAAAGLLMAAAALGVVKGFRRRV
jgi:hypothetical protein